MKEKSEKPEIKDIPPVSVVAGNGESQYDNGYDDPDEELV